MALELVQPLLTIIGLATDGYSILSGISHGRQIKSMRRQIETLNGRVQTLSDRIFYAPTFELVQHIERRVVGIETGQRQIRELLQPIQHALHDTILASRLIQAPADLRKEMRDPWSLLVDVRPLSRVTAGIYPGKIPVMFFEEDLPYVGWLDAAELTRDFKIKYCPSVRGPGNSKSLKRTFIDMRTFRMGHVRVYRRTTRSVSIICEACLRRFEVTLISNENYVPCMHCRHWQILDISWSPN